MCGGAAACGARRELECYCLPAARNAARGTCDRWGLEGLPVRVIQRLPVAGGCLFGGLALCGASAVALPPAVRFEDAAQRLTRGTHTRDCRDGCCARKTNRELEHRPSRATGGPISSRAAKSVYASHTSLRTGAVTPLTARRERFAKNAAQQLHRPRAHSTLETNQHRSTQPQRTHKQEWSRE